MTTKMLNERQTRLLMNSLFALLTITEASELFQRHPNTIRYHIDKNHVVYRVTEQGIYLISRESLISLYGVPLLKVSQYRRRNLAKDLLQKHAT